MIRLQEHYNTIILSDWITKLNVTNVHAIPQIESISIQGALPMQEETTIIGVRSLTKKIIKKKYMKPTIKSNIPKKTQELTPRDSLQTFIQQWNGSKPTNLSDREGQIWSDLYLLSGQWPQETFIKRSVPGTTIREGKLAGFNVTLRKDSMYIFLERLIEDILPNTKDFKSFQNVMGTKLQGDKTNKWRQPKSALSKTYGSKFDGRGNFQITVKNATRHLPPLFGEKEATHAWNIQISIKTTAKTDKEARLLLTGFQIPWNIDQ